MRSAQHRGGKRRRRLELKMLAPLTVEQDPDAWVDSLTDGELADIISPGWYALTGRNVGHLVPDCSTDEGASHAA